MSASHGPIVTMARYFCLAILCTLVLYVVSFAVTGGKFAVDTSLTDMVPQAAQKGSKLDAVNISRKYAESSIVYLLASENLSQLQLAQQSLETQLDSASDRLLRVDQQQLTQTLVATLAPFRFKLLSEKHQLELAKADTSELLNDAVAELYSPGARFRALTITEDPFNLFGSWLQSAGNTEALKDPENENQRIVSIRLLGNYNGASEQKALVSFFDALGTSIKINYPEVELKRSGVLFFAHESAKSARQDVNLISTGSLVVLLCVFFLVFRSGWPVLVPLLSIAVGVVSAFALVHWWFGSVHVFTIVFGASLIGIVIDYSIHYFYHMSGRPTEIESSSRASRNNSKLYRALVLSLITSALGFTALLFSALPSLQKIALFSVTGLVTAWTVVIAIAPMVANRIIVRANLISSVTRGLTHTVNVVSSLIDIRLYTALLTVTLLVVIGFMQGQDDPRRFIDMPQNLLSETKLVNQVVSVVEPGRFLLVTASDKEGLFATLDKVYAQVQESRELVSIRDWLPSPEFAGSNYKLQEKVYRDKGLADQLFKTIGSSAEKAGDLRRQFEKAANNSLEAEMLFDRTEGMMLPLVFRSGEVLAGYVLLNKGGDFEVLQNVASTVSGAEYVNTVAETTALLRAQRISSLVALIVSYVLLGMLLMLLYGLGTSIRMLCVPATATLIVLFAFTLGNQPVTLFHTMALFMVLGLGMDYVIFLNEMTSESSATRQAIVLSAITTLVSFGLLSLSSIPVARAFGLTILLGNSLNLCLALAIFPCHSSSRCQKGLHEGT